jgi:molybdopterin molybdotransferase
MTGAPVPPDADVVIRREDTDEGKQPGDSKQFGESAHTERAAQSVGIRLPSCRRFQNIARKGEDMQAGDTAIGAPSVIGPAVTGILASLGKDECLVERLPRVALFTTGDEVVAVDAPVSPIQIRNSNRWIMQSLLKGWGISPCHYEHLPDIKTVLRDSLQKVITGPSSASDSAPADIIILSGGVSAGDADYVPGILEELGVQRLFHKIAIKPGKPVWCGITPGGEIVFALPGNPFSGMVGFTLLIQPYLHACFGLAAPVQMGLPLAAPKKKKTPLDEFFPVRVTGSPARLQTVDINGSGDSRLGLYANALALHPADSGDLVKGTNLLYYSL